MNNKKKKQLKKIVLIGPVYPFKGGISHYTGMMYHALSKKYDVKMISFKMQYPKILFKKEQRDYENDKFMIEDTKYWIHTANPFNIIKTAQKIKKLIPDLIIFQWWHPYFAPCYWILEKILCRFPILFICHNVFPHERFPMDKKLTRMTLKRGDGFIVQSSLDAKDLQIIKRNPKYTLTVHPTYNAFKMKDMSQKEGRELLGINKEEQVLLFFGFVREYKGLKYLLDALPTIRKELPKVKLLVVGDFDGDKDKYLEQINSYNGQDIVDIYDGYIPDQEVEKYFAACDLVVLPYESATQSGIVQIAYGFEKACIVTNVGGLPEVVLDGKTGYVVESKNSEQIAAAIKKYFVLDKEEEFRNYIRGEAYKYSWERMTEHIEKLYEGMYE